MISIDLFIYVFSTGEQIQGLAHTKQKACALPSAIHQQFCLSASEGNMKEDKLEKTTMLHIYKSATVKSMVLCFNLKTQFKSLNLLRTGEVTQLQSTSLACMRPQG